MIAPELQLLYVDGESIGYGRMGVYIANELRARGVDLYDDDFNPDTTQRTASGELLNTGRRTRETPCNTICWMSVPSHMVGWHEGQHRAFVTMWEAQELPESFRETFDSIDTIIVPSQHNVELFSQFHDNVHFMPLGVDPALWHYSPPPPVDNEFRFFINGRGSRKGVDLAFKAFRTVFRNSDGFHPRPILVMKSMKAHGDMYASNIRQVSGRLDPQAELELYQSCHAYLGPSRGEGFGLAPLQAIALGRPTILTAAHGQASYAHLGVGLSTTDVPADYFIYGAAGHWWEPDFDELCEAMWDVYSNYAAHLERAAESAKTVARDWTWANTTTRFYDILSRELNTPYSGSGAWVKAPRRLFRIRTIRDFQTEIAGRTLRFTQGVDYWEVADVKRILFDGGILDPECFETADHGLAEVQVEQMELMRAQNEHCPTCRERVNTRPKYSDELWVEMEERRLREWEDDLAAREAAVKLRSAGIGAGLG